MWELDGRVYETLEQLQRAARKKEAAAGTPPPAMDLRQAQIANLVRVLTAISRLIDQESDSESTSRVDPRPPEGVDQLSKASSEPAPAPTGPLGLEELRAFGLPGARPDWDVDGDRWWRTTGVVDLEAHLEPVASTSDYKYLLGMEMAEEYWSEEQRARALADPDLPTPRWTWADIERVVIDWNAHVEARNRRERAAWAAGVKRRFERELLEALQLLAREAAEFTALREQLADDYRRHPEAFEAENR